MTERVRTGRSWRGRAMGAAMGVAVLAAVLSLCSCGSANSDSASTAPESCNGSPRLCERRLDEVIFPATHNSYAASDEPGWYFANQRYPISRQLHDGIRALLIDVHFGVYDAATGRVRTDLRAEGSDRNKVAQQLPAQALRVADRVAGRVGVGTLEGTPSLYLCHTLCELGAEPLGSELDVIRGFLQKHPDQVVILVVEDYVPPASIETAFQRAGLLPYVATLDRHSPAPTLRQLISQGHRLVVFAEDHGGSPSWYMPAFSFIQDTPLGARTPLGLSCTRFRGEVDSPLLLINNWLEIFPPLPAANAPLGRAVALRGRIARCMAERRIAGALVAVDFYERTDLVAVAAALNDGQS